MLSKSMVRFNILNSAKLKCYRCGPVWVSATTTNKIQKYAFANENKNSISFWRQLYNAPALMFVLSIYSSAWCLRKCAAGSIVPWTWIKMPYLCSIFKVTQKKNQHVAIRLILLVEAIQKWNASIHVLHPLLNINFCFLHFHSFHF